MAVQITDKFQYFKDLDGDALNSGYVYIGTTGFNAQETAITVYSDLAMTIPIAQPIRTSGGHLVNNGSPINVYTSADYSILIKDSDSTLVYSSLSGNIEATQTAAEAAQTNAEAAQTNAEAAQVLAEQAVTDAAAAAQAVLDANTIASGTYTATLTDSDNVASSLFSSAYYTRVGDIVNVSCRIAITPTAGATYTSIGISLPITSNFTAVTQAAGVGASYNGGYGSVSSDIASDIAIFGFTSLGTIGYAFGIDFQYQVV